MYMMLPFINDVILHHSNVNKTLRQFFHAQTKTSDSETTTNHKTRIYM